MRLFLDNPILGRDLRLRFREKRFIVTLTLCLGLLFLIVAANWPHQNASLWFVARAGKDAFAVIAMTLLTLLMIITASFAATSLSSEKEARTIETLFISTTSDWEIVLGKLNAANIHNLLTLAATFPLTLALFALGGISAGEVAACYGVIALVCYTFSSMGILWSAVFLRSTRNANGMTVFTGLIWVALPALLPLFLSLLMPGGSWREAEELAKWTLVINPYFGMISVFEPPERIFGSFAMPVYIMFFCAYAAFTLLFLVLAKEVLGAKRRNFRP